MTRYLVDSSVLIDVLRAAEPALGWWQRLEAVPLCSEVSRAEILRGVRSSERPATERLLQSLVWVVVDEAVSRTAGELGRTYQQSHGQIGVADLIIAASAQERGAKLATTNVRHFPMFRGLEAPYSS